MLPTVYSSFPVYSNVLGSNRVLHVFTVGTDYGQEAIESAAAFLFKTFHNKDQVGHEETRAIKQMFGPFPASAAEASCVAVTRLVAQIGESQTEAFIQTQTFGGAEDHGTSFGRNIAFSFDTYTLESPDALPPDHENGNGRDLDFTSFLSNHAAGRSSGSDAAAGSNVAATGQSSGADSSVLRSEVERYLSGGNMGTSSAEELCTSLFEMLTSTRSDDELQNEVRTMKHLLI